MRGATSPDDGVRTYGIYLPAARAGAVLVMVERARSGDETRELALALGTLY